MARAVSHLSCRTLGLVSFGPQFLLGYPVEKAHHSSSSYCSPETKYDASRVERCSHCREVGGHRTERRRQLLRTPAPLRLQRPLHRFDTVPHIAPAPAAAASPARAAPDATRGPERQQAHFSPRTRLVLSRGHPDETRHPKSVRDFRCFERSALEPAAP